MTLRHYRITIKPRNGFVLPNHVPAVLGCSVSEPSALSAAPRGLTFMNENGSVLDDHPVFSHRYHFTRQMPGNPPELAEVDNFVWTLLAEHNIGTTHVNVFVKSITDF